MLGVQSSDSEPLRNRKNQNQFTCLQIFKVKKCKFIRSAFGEDQLAKSGEKWAESGRADEVLGECAVDQSAIFKDDPELTLLIAQILHSAVDRLASAV